MWSKLAQLLGLVNVSRFFAENWIFQEVCAELHNGTTRANVCAFGDNAQVDILARFKSRTGKCDCLPVDFALRITCD